MRNHFLSPASDGLEEFEEPVRLPVFREAWSPAARAAALQSRRARMRGAQLVARAAQTAPQGDRGTQGVLQTFGPEAGHAIKTNLQIRHGVTSKTAQIGSTFMSNDRRTVYSGKVRGMRQKIMSWAKSNNKVLPSGFENRSSVAIAGMFRGMAKGGYFGPPTRNNRTTKWGNLKETELRETWSDAARAAAAAHRKQRRDRGEGKTTRGSAKGMAAAAYRKAGGVRAPLMNRDTMAAAGIRPDTFAKNKKGEYVARFGYFYRHGGSEEKHANMITKAFPRAKITHTADNWKPFRGGSSTANQSHFEIRFKHPPRVIGAPKGTQRPGEKNYY